MEEHQDSKGKGHTFHLQRKLWELFLKQSRFKGIEARSRQIRFIG